MATEKAELIRLLEAELDFIEGGGYANPSREPNKTQPMFYHSLVCINHWLVPDHESECHEDCVLMEVVPKEHKSAGLPCHFIPLNEAGDTVKSLEDKGDRGRLEEAVKNWLRTTIERLKEGENPLGVTDVKY
jgi:hypothetical protein